MLLLLICFLSLLPCPGSSRTVMDVLASRFDLITFTNFLRSTNLDTVLNSGHHMVIVPTDTAFNHLPDGYIAMLHDTNHPYNQHLLPDLLKYHIVPYTGQLDAHWTGDNMKTLLSKPVRIITDDVTNVTVANGVVMTDPKLNASNGHIYLVNQILNPPQANIYTTLMEDDRFSTFLSALTLAGMGHKLKDDNITVFASTNTAFQYLNTNVSKKLFNNHDELRAFAHYYVVPGIYYTRALPQGQLIEITSSNCFLPPLHFNVHSKNNVRLYPGPIPIAQPDWSATNGVIHVIERVLIPRVRCHNWQ